MGDDQGVVHYGDTIPPQYAQRESTILNKEGVPIGHKDATKSAAELAILANAEQQAARQKQHDSFLLATYTSVKDIEQLRDERLLQIKGQRVAAEQYVASLGERLSALQARAQNFKPYSTRPDAHRMPDDLAEQMVHTLNDIRSQKAALNTSMEEEAKTQSQFQSGHRPLQGIARRPGGDSLSGVRQPRPECPKPPAPRALTAKSSTTSSATCTNRHPRPAAQCARRVSMVKALCPRFHIDIIS